MLDFFKRLLGMPTKQEQAVAEAPYKVEVAPVVEAAPYKAPEPAPTTPIPFVPAGTEASVAAPVVAEKTATKPKPAARTAKPKAAAKAPVKAPAKTPAKPKAPRKSNIRVAK